MIRSRETGTRRGDVTVSSPQAEVGAGDRWSDPNEIALSLAWARAPLARCMHDIGQIVEIERPRRRRRRGRT